MSFSCSVCNYTSNIRQSIIKHIHKKTKCGENPQIISSEADIKCEYCNKSYTTHLSMVRHLKICKSKEKKDKLEIELDEKNQEVEKLKKENEILTALVKKPNITNNNTQNNTQNINITLTPWNNPKLPPNIEEYYKQAIKKVFMAVPTLVKLIHFNEEHPENHNICIRNARNGLAKVFNGKDWDTVNEDEVIRSLIYDYEESLNNYAEEHNLDYVEKMNKIKLRDTEEKVYDDMHIEIKRAVHDRNKLIKIR